VAPHFYIYLKAFQEGWDMASNFKITTDKKNDGFGLQLNGDFDATSAWELIYAIKKLPEDAIRVAIFTDGLKDILPFGLHVFHRFMRSLNGQFTRIVFTGSNASRLSPHPPREVSYISAYSSNFLNQPFKYVADLKRD
jgi:hypothetical protein